MTGSPVAFGNGLPPNVYYGQIPQYPFQYGMGPPVNQQGFPQGYPGYNPGYYNVGAYPSQQFTGPQRGYHAQQQYPRGQQPPQQGGYQQQPQQQRGSGPAGFQEGPKPPVKREPRALSLINPATHQPVELPNNGALSKPHPQQGHARQSSTHTCMDSRTLPSIALSLSHQMRCV